MSKHLNGVDWSYYDKFEDIEDKYLPSRGEGDTMATQIVVATAKLVYKWYNDGDVYDNTHYIDGWWNDLSSYANWLYNNVSETQVILGRIAYCLNDSDYEELLKDLVDLTNTEEFLGRYKDIPKKGTIYECEGIFHFDEQAYED